MEGSVAAPIADVTHVRRGDYSSAIGWAFALAAHGALIGSACVLGVRVRESAEAPIAVRIDHVVDLAPPEPPPPPPPPPPERTQVRQDAAEPTPEEAAPALAAAAEVIAAPEVAEELDFSESIVTGNAASFAGGTTHTAGTSTTHVNAPGATTNGTGGDGTAPVAASRARGARIAPRAWRCNVPDGADPGDPDPSVMLRVTVDARGHATEVSVVSAPDSRTGEAAAACARRTRFEPALDDGGAAIGATLPTLRVRLVRL